MEARLKPGHHVGASAAALDVPGASPERPRSLAARCQEGLLLRHTTLSHKLK